MNAILVQAAADFEGEGWKITWNEEEENFRAVNRSLSNGEIVVSVINDKLLIERE